MRIKVITPVATDQDSLQRRAESIPAYLLRPGLEVSIVGPRNGSPSLTSPYDAFLAEVGVFDAGLSAEAEGFDAICIDTIADSALEPLRSKHKIPVVGAGQVAFNVAGMLGKHFSIISIGRAWHDTIEKVLALNQLEAHLASIRDVEVPKVNESVGSIAQRLEIECRRAIDDEGADTIILGHPWLEVAAPDLSRHLAIPVIAPGIWSIKFAETLHDLHLSHSKNAYRTPATDFDHLMRDRLRTAWPEAQKPIVVKAQPNPSKLRIKVVVPVSGMDQAALDLRAQALPPGLLLTTTKVDYVDLSDSSQSADNQYDSFLLEVFCFEEAIKAQPEGYGAVLIDSTTDSGMMAIRSRLDILGLGPGLACWSVAAVLGNRFSILAMEDKWNHFYEKNLKLFGLRHKLASVPNVGIAPDPVHLFEGKEEKMNKALKEIGEAAIRNDGADVLVLGSTTMHQATAYLTSVLPVPVLSPGRTGVRVAEMLLEMGVTQSKVAFPSPAQPRDWEVFAPHKEPTTAAR